MVEIFIPVGTGTLPLDAGSGRTWRIPECLASVLFAIVVMPMASIASLAGPGNATSATQVAAAAPSGDPALALVRRFNMGAGLESLVSEVAHATVSFGVIVHERGSADAEKLLKAEISKALPAYQERWNRNLARLCSRHFSAQELRSLTRLGTSSPYAGKFETTHEAVGAEMREASSQLLQQLVAEALTKGIGR